MINKFYGAYRFLSNFYEIEIFYNKEWYKTAEHAYQAEKTIIQKEKILFLDFSISPAQAKQIGKTITLREDWNEVKLDVMYNIVKAKFSCDVMKEKLLKTEDQELIEGNYWHDYYWGECNGQGQNNLGKILMRIREELK